MFVDTTAGTTIGTSYANAEIDSQKRCVDEYHPVSDSLTEGGSTNSHLLEQCEQTAQSGSQQNRKRGKPRDESKLTTMQHDCVRLNPSEPFKEGIANSFDQRCKRRNKTSELAKRHMQEQKNPTLGVCSTLNASVHHSGEGSSYDVMKGSFPHNRKRGRPRNDCKTTPVQHNCLEPNAQVHPPSVLHGYSQPLQSDAFKRREKTIEPATRYVHQQNSMVDLHPNLDTRVHDAGEGPSSNVIEETFRQTRKRGRPRNTSTSGRVRRCSTLRNTSPHSGQNSSTQSTNNISETSASYASPVAKMASSHATQSATQPQKRNRRTRQSSAACGNGRSQNITQGSTSYTPENTSHPYDDLGDCTECCNYCNAAFWRGERLAGHGYASHVSHYHLCCGNGKVFMQPEPDPPEYIKQLLGDATFMENIRAYNQMFAMTSFGATIGSTVNQGRGPYVFKVSGKIYNRIGSLCPTGDDDPKFLQLYIYDTRNEVRNRLNPFSNPDSPPLDPEIVQEFKIRLYSGRGYELQSSNSLGAIVFDRGPESESNYDVVLEYRDGQVKRISKIHKSYMSLQFPLIFIYGQPGFHTKLMLRTANPDDEP
ncbi:helitron helicase-like domain-containing protein [Artemisia annua]|uniref:Helitron helicase-like domain-containing protein n=1 Tax=Artemisia annua TaxID=35608 RepID=A0A2U1QGT7_ARTAN|nr:helitron helicase-like domain-containing protein [Artemisia annua]